MKKSREIRNTFLGHALTLQNEHSIVKCRSVSNLSLDFRAHHVHKN
jgi:hypothetical protein